MSRFIDGLSGSAFLSVAGGTVGDMFKKEELQAPMIVYTASPMLGPAIGTYTHWRQWATIRSNISRPYCGRFH